MKQAYILDTNVLLFDPQVLYAFPDAEIIIPQAVLGELDKLKTARVDSRLRFHGREISRILFELSQESQLVEGVELDNGSTLRVLSFSPNQDLPDVLKTKNSDDQIIALAYQQAKQRPKDVVTLVTNDLNMLIKAQTFGIKVRHYERELAFGFFGRVVDFFRTKRRAITWVVIPIVLIALAVAFYARFERTDMPPELLAELEPFQIKEYAYEQILKKDPSNLKALVGLGNLYFDAESYQRAVDFYRKALKIDGTNLNVRTDLGTAYFNIGLADSALEEYQRVLKINPRHPRTHYNMGVVLWVGKGDIDGAINEFDLYLKLQPDGPYARSATENIKQLQGLKQKQQQKT